MATEIWRLTRERYADSAFSGEGARQHGGRFNSPGIPIVYAAESLPLALVETSAGLERYDQLRRYVFFRAELPETQVSEVEEDDLPEGWDRHPPPSQPQRMGDRWASNEESVALRVPSVVVPYSYNYLLNPAHPAFNSVEVGPEEPFPVDKRLIPER
ncbi:RES family NAD+ phosphorylase [Salinibacter altiplanensis]|uniref:RES family NAD+ phosphorylase n=1 Tax=Salinibacter altiplanensis TaxID=1803181 RepID=UPI000C9F4E14|nr:RES family NAD+ phosphorylase [Salinibacter altiplanensis]